MKILGVILGVLMATVMAAQQSATALVEGVVVELGTDKPLPGTTVELRTEQGISISVTTDRDGRFLVPGVQPGSYRLLARQPGFVRGEYGERTGTTLWKGVPVGMSGMLAGAAWDRQWNRGGPSSRGLTIGAGHRLTGLRIVLTPGGVITGRVLTGGKPAVNVPVHALKVSYEPGGGAILSRILSGVTNDLGEYHIFWLPSGHYYVMADRSDFVRNPPPVMFIDFIENPLISRGPGQAELGRAASSLELSRIFLQSGGISDSEMRVPTFFPNKPDWHTAQMIEIAPGAEFRNADINADPLPALHIRGTVTGLPSNAQGQPVRPAIALFTRGEMPTGLVSTTAYASIQADPNGAFDIPRIPPGSYLLQARAGNFIGRIPVDVWDRDVSVTVPVAAGLAVTGRVVFEPGSVQMAGLQMGLRMESAGAPPTPVRLAADGSFTIPGILPSENYRVFVRPFLLPLGSLPTGPLPPELQGAYVKSAVWGQTDVLNDGLRLGTEPRQQLVITIGADAGSVEGRVVKDGQPAPATVVLIPEGGQRFHVPHLFTYADESGRFHISGVPPGDYKLFGWQTIEPGAWQNAGYMRAYESQGKLVRIAESAKVTDVELLAIP